MVPARRIQRIDLINLCRAQRRIAPGAPGQARKPFGFQLAIGEGREMYALGTVACFAGMVVFSALGIIVKGFIRVGIGNLTALPVLPDQELLIVLLVLQIWLSIED